MNLYPPEDLTIEGAGRAIRAGLRTCVDVLESCLGRIEEWEPKVNAWALVDREGALAQARERDQELAQGKDRGPLHGIPFGIKDIVDVAGLPTSAGVRLWADGPAGEDAGIVAWLREVGAVILGKTVTTPYAWVDPPPTRNPWDLGRTPGGSSSGSAAAMACGMCLGAVGTQTGGSLTRPAAFCGVASFKPADGLFASSGIAPLAPSLDTPGFLARTVGDLALIWDGLMSSWEQIDVYMDKGLRLTSQAARDYAMWSLGRRGLRVSLHEAQAGPPAYPMGRPPVLGRVRGFFQDLVEPAARVIHESALMDLVAAGAQVVDVELPEAFDDVHRPHRVVMAAEAASVHSSRIARLPRDYPARIASLIEEGRAISAPDYLQALELRRALRAATDRAIAPVHALIVPAALGPAPGPETTGDPSFNSPWNFVQLPTVSFPIGLSGEGLPLAIQVVGHRFDAPLGVAGWCEQVIRQKRS